MSDLSLQELLDSVGLSKTDLAERLGVSRMTVNRWGDDVKPEVMVLIESIQEKLKLVSKVSDSGHKLYPAGVYVPMGERVKEPEDYTKEEVLKLCKRRGGIENDAKRTRETDYEIAHSIGMKVFEFNRMIRRV